MRDLEKMIREQWFPNHRATLEVLKGQDGREITTLRWQKPGTGTYGVRYVLQDGVLMVHGDIGSAVYNWYSPKSFEWLASLDGDYFAGKCEASETGRGAKEWNDTTAEEEFERHLNQYSDERARYEVLVAEDEYAAPDFSSQDGWVEWLRAHGDDIFGSDCWELYDIGQQTATRTIGHLIGIKMAVQQLATQAVETAPANS